MELSIELLSKVIKKEVKEFVIEKNELRYILEYDKNSIPELYFINIYELAYKCKEWAIKNDFFIFSGYNGNYNCFVNHSGNRFFGDSEIESIFKACQWILENKEG